LRASIIITAAAAGCSIASGPTAHPDKPDFVLTCSGIGQVTTKAGQQSRIIFEKMPTQISLRWNDENNTLYTHLSGVKYSPFCNGIGQEICNVEILDTRITANSLDIIQGKLPNQASGFEENIAIDRTTLSGSYVTKSSTGTFTDREFEAIFKVEVKIPLDCR
jgi:hypothetical protein